jgi:hypothetical protein
MSLDDVVPEVLHWETSFFLFFLSSSGEQRPKPLASALVSVPAAAQHGKGDLWA